MLNQTQVQNIINAEKVIFSTADKNGKPRSIWVVPSRVEKDRIIVSNIQMEKTIWLMKTKIKNKIKLILTDEFFVDKNF